MLCSMTGRFHKMHGLGNDFVVIDARLQSLAMTATRVRAIADRKTGIGCDQVVLIESSTAADARLRFFNADGSEAAACGNGTRAAALLIGQNAVFETQGGLLKSRVEGMTARIDMGEPRFAWDAVPLAYAMDTAELPVAWDDLDRPSALSVGNPHIVLFAADNDADMARRAITMGPVIEHDPLFPERVNVNFARIDAPDRIALWTWERGTGHTRACGTGACATAVAALRTGRAKGIVCVTQPGGDLIIEWTPGNAIIMAGPATYVYSGDTNWDIFGT
jgi:diaminopimelate epimerase